MFFYGRGTSITKKVMDGVSCNIRIPHFLYNSLEWNSIALPYSVILHKKMKLNKIISKIDIYFQS